MVRRGSLGPALACTTPGESDVMQAGKAWLPARSNELGLVVCGNKPTAKPFHSCSLSVVTMAWTLAKRVHEAVSSAWAGPDHSFQPSWSLLCSHNPTLTFHSLAVLCLSLQHSLSSLQPTHFASFHHPPFLLFACWHVLADTPSSSDSSCLIHGSVAPARPCKYPSFCQPEAATHCVPALPQSVIYLDPTQRCYSPFVCPSGEA
jgi:hypothetical protein